MKKACLSVLILFLISCKVFADGTYSDQVDEISPAELTKLTAKFTSPNFDKLIHLSCFEIPGDKLYIGLWHGLIINAPLKDTVTVLDDFGKYAEVFDGIADTKIIKKLAPDRWLIEFEDKSPVFFMSNVHYQMEYQLISIASGKIYKYHLSNLYPQKNIVNSDGLIFLKEENGKTKFYELDFFKANWGVLGNLAGPNIWKDSVKELAVSDLELKYKAENLKITPTEKKEKIQQALKLIKEDELFDKCVANKLSVKNFFEK